MQNNALHLFHGYAQAGREWFLELRRAWFSVHLRTAPQYWLGATAPFRLAYWPVEEYNSVLLFTETITGNNRRLLMQS